VPGTDGTFTTPAACGEKRSVTAIPPVEEQRAIADFLDHASSNIDRITAKTRAQISKFQEYRTALISAAVTGKIDVRGIGGESAGVDKCSQIAEHWHLAD
jgi:hypothetical protein